MRILVQLGFDDHMSGSQVFVRAWKADRQCAQSNNWGAGHLVPWSFQPGEAFRSIGSEDWAVIAGELKLQVAHIKLSISRAIFGAGLFVYRRNEMLFDAHWHAFRVFGASRRGIYDNIRTAVTGRTRQAARCERVFLGWVSTVDATL